MYRVRLSRQIHSIVGRQHTTSGSDDKTVRLWSVSERQEIAVLKGHTKEVLSVAFDGSGKYIASGSGDMSGSRVRSNGACTVFREDIAISLEQIYE